MAKKSENNTSSGTVFVKDSVDGASSMRPTKPTSQSSSSSQSTDSDSKKK